ncbi:MAG: hypothetical protein AAGL90_13255 [Pseudomonadota bacterium]
MIDDEVHIQIRDTNFLTSSEMNRIIELIEANYDEADPTYIDKSVGTPICIAFASKSSKLVGFGETRIMPLTR